MPMSLAPRNDLESATELLKAILDFVARVAYPVLIGGLLLVYRKQMAALFAVLSKYSDRILGRVAEGKVDLSIGPLALKTAQDLRNEDINAAAKKVEDLLSPAVPLALGYVENFLDGVVIEGGTFQYELDASLRKYAVAKSFTICIPRELRKIDGAATNLVRDEYSQEKIEIVAIRSKFGRPFTGFAILREDVLYPVDVPKTLTSIQRVFDFRKQQLNVNAHMSLDDIKKLECKNLDEFETVLKDNTQGLRDSGCIRVIRDPQDLTKQA